MATGGFCRVKKCMSETKGRSSNWSRSSKPDKDEVLSPSSFPSDVRVNHWDVSDLHLKMSSNDPWRKKSKGNSEREREQSRSIDPLPSGGRRHRTTYSVSRTGNTPKAEQAALERLKTRLTYDDEHGSVEAGRNNERAVHRNKHRPMMMTTTTETQREAVVGSAHEPTTPQCSKTYKNNDDLADFTKQAQSMMDMLQKSEDSSDMGDLAKVQRLISSLNEQEQGYLNLLHADETSRSYVDRNEFLSSEGKVRKVDSESTESVKFEEVSAISDDTVLTSSSRPRIEDKLGLDSDNECRSDGSNDEDTTVSGVGPISDSYAGNFKNESLHDSSRESADIDCELTVEQRKHLLRMMQEKQEQLRHLQGRQGQLLSMKEEAEKRLKEAETRDNQGSQTPARGPPSFSPHTSSSAATPTGSVHKSQTVSVVARAALAVVECGHAMLSEDWESALPDKVRFKSNIAPQLECGIDGMANGQAVDKFSELQRQLCSLRNELFLEPGKSSGVKTDVDSSGGVVCGAGVGSTAPPINHNQQQQLLEKLVDLQEKKRDMDQFLDQLETLRSQQLRASNKETSSNLPEVPPPKPPLPPPVTRLSPRSPSSGMAGRCSNEFSNIGCQGGPGDSFTLDDELKMQKLHEVRQRLNQLRDLVEYYEKVKSKPAEDAVKQETSLTPASRSCRQEVSVLQQAALPHADRLGTSADLRCSAAGSPFRQMQDRFIDVCDEEQSNEDNASAEGMEPTLEEAGLTAARSKKVVNNKSRKDELVDLQCEIDSKSVCKVYADISQNSNSGYRASQHRNSYMKDSLHQNTPGTPDTGLRKQSDLPQRMQPCSWTGDDALEKRVEELRRLQDERQSLICLQQELTGLQRQRYLNMERERPNLTHQKGSVSRPPSSTNVVTFASNDELYSKMRDQRIVREELRSKKKALEAIMKKDHNRKQYQRNQDNHSDTISFTTGTDAFGVSASADATVATWGESTADNLENIFEDEDGQSGDEDDAGYPSDGIVQVEEEEEDNETDAVEYRGVTVSTSPLAKRELNSQARPKSSRGFSTFPQPAISVGGKRSSKRPQSQPWARKGHKEKEQQSKDLSQLGEVRSDLQQLHKTVERLCSFQEALCQAPHLTASIADSQPSQLTNAARNVSGELPGRQPDAQTHLLHEMQQHQQLMMVISQCHRQLMMQQLDMATMHRQLQQLSMQLSTTCQLPVTAPPSQLASVDASVRHTSHLHSVLIPSQPILSPFCALGATVPINTPTSGFDSKPPSQNMFLGSPNVTSNHFFTKDDASAVTQMLPHFGPISAGKDGEGAVGKAQSHGEEEAGEGVLSKIDFSGKNKPTAAKTELELHISSAIGVSKSVGVGNDGEVNVSVADRDEMRRRPDQVAVGLHADNLGAINLFEILRESIYKEVAALISQNENRPQYLLQVFSELQKMASDVMRQRALFAIQEIGQSSLSRYSGEAIVKNESQTVWIPHLGSERAADWPHVENHVPCYDNDDDDDIKAHVARHVSSLAREQQHQRARVTVDDAAQFTDDRDEDHIQPAHDAFSLSTPTDDTQGCPSFEDELTDAVLCRNHIADPGRGQCLRHDFFLDPTAEKRAGIGAQIDTQALSEQIKDVVSQVIPVMKEHIDLTFTVNLLAYIKRLVLSLIRHPGRNDEFARFFYGQLASILHDSLRRFEGRRVRVVGQDVLQEVSEVLFNELAFLRIMKELDDVDEVEKMRKPPVFGGGYSGWRQNTLGVRCDDSVTDGNESDNEASDNDDDDVTPKNLTVHEGNDVVDESEKPCEDEHDDCRAITPTVDGDKAAGRAVQSASPSSSVHIQLVVSERKPFTRIGSDEDTGGSDESVCLDDPSDTAVSHSAAVERGHSHASDAASVAADAGYCWVVDNLPEVNGMLAEKGKDAQEADCVLDYGDLADPESDGSVDRVDLLQVNGHVGCDCDEVGFSFDDLPPVLDVVDPEEMDRQRCQEARQQCIVECILRATDGIE